MMNSMKKPVVIVGGGMAGLACATTLHETAVPFELYEASDRWGGRVGSIRKNGFVLDLGFQVFLDAYPTAAKLLHLEALDLKPYASGALVARPGGMDTLADPLRHPGRLPQTLRGPLPIPDLVRLGRLTLRVKAMETAKALSVPDETTLEFLRARGFSDRALAHFWRPFLGGIFLEPDLATSSRMFHFVFSLFAKGRATLPREGMQAIPDQLVAALPREKLRMNARVAEIQPGGVRLETGEWREAERVVDARDPWAEQSESPEARGTSCFYYACEKRPWTGPWLVLCPGQKHLNTLTAPSELHPNLAPEGKHLVSVSSLNPASAESDVRGELAALFGQDVKSWELLDRMEIPRALPAQGLGWLTPPSRTAPEPRAVIRAGDFLETASIEGALQSGVLAAQSILEF